MSKARKTVIGIKCDACRKELYVEGVSELNLSRIHCWRRILIKRAKTLYSWGYNDRVVLTEIKHICPVCDQGPKHLELLALKKKHATKIKKLGLKT